MDLEIWDLLQSYFYCILSQVLHFQLIQCVSMYASTFIYTVGVCVFLFLPICCELLWFINWHGTSPMANLKYLICVKWCKKNINSTQVGRHPFRTSHVCPLGLFFMLVYIRNCDLICLVVKWLSGLLSKQKLSIQVSLLKSYI